MSEVASDVELTCRFTGRILVTVTQSLMTC